jgi:hypothetical protein
MAYLTYFDVVEHLIAASFGGPQDAEQRDIRTAVHRCYAEIGNIRDWSWQHAHGRVVTVAPVTRTVSYLSGATLQLSGLTGISSGYSHVRIGTRVAEVQSVSPGSGLTITLSIAVNFPTGTVENGDTATFYRTLYDLPADFRNLDEPSDEFNWWSGAYVTPDEAMKMERVNFQTGSPLHWTVIKSPVADKYVLKLVGYPTAVETIDFTYRRGLRSLRWSGHEAVARTGTVDTVSSAPLPVVGTSTEFSPSMVGSIIRFGTTSDTPGPITSIAPYVDEREILSRSSATNITVSGGDTSYTGVKYLVTDPIDLPEHMHNVMLSGAEYWLARIRSNNVEEKYQLYQRDLRLAMEADQLAPISGRSKRIWTDGGWRSPLLADNFDFAN